MIHWFLKRESECDLEKFRTVNSVPIAQRDRS